MLLEKGESVNSHSDVAVFDGVTVSLGSAEAKNGILQSHLLTAAVMPCALCLLV